MWGKAERESRQSELADQYRERAVNSLRELTGCDS
jgi:hypothetical protein